MSIIKQTNRIVIREFLPEEQSVYLNHFNDEAVTLYLPKRSREERINIFNTALEQYRVTNKTGIWGMFNNHDSDFIGSCLLRNFSNNEPGVIELGYSMEKKYWGSGLGTEMAIAMIAHAFTDTNTQQVVAVTDLDNIGSQRVLEKAGLKRVENLLRDGTELAYFKSAR